MAPNPSYLTLAERIIIKALINHHEAEQAGYIGGTSYGAIYRALVAAGLLEKEEAKEHNHFDNDLYPDSCEVCATYNIKEI